MSLPCLAIKERSDLLIDGGFDDHEVGAVPVLLIEIFAPRIDAFFRKNAAGFVGAPCRPAQSALPCVLPACAV